MHVLWWHRCCFVFLDFQEKQVNEKAENEVANMADKVFNPIIEQISEADEEEQKFFNH